jgi:hypothetical protein
MNPTKEASINMTNILMSGKYDVYSKKGNMPVLMFKSYDYMYEVGLYKTEYSLYSPTAHHALAIGAIILNKIDRDGNEVTDDIYEEYGMLTVNIPYESGMETVVLDNNNGPNLVDAFLRHISWYYQNSYDIAHSGYCKYPKVRLRRSFIKSLPELTDLPDFTEE